MDVSITLPQVAGYGNGASSKALESTEYAQAKTGLKTRVNEA